MRFQKSKLVFVKQAYSYIRFSSPEQARGDSLRRQLEASRYYADKHKSYPPDCECEPGKQYVYRVV